MPKKKKDDKNKKDKEKEKAEKAKVKEAKEKAAKDAAEKVKKDAAKAADLARGQLRIGEHLTGKMAKATEDQKTILGRLTDADYVTLPPGDTKAQIERFKAIMGALFQMYVAGKDANVKLAYGLAALGLCKAAGSLPKINDTCKLQLWQVMPPTIDVKEKQLDKAACDALRKLIADIQEGITKCTLFGGENVDKLAQEMAKLLLG